MPQREPGLAVLFLERHRYEHLQREIAAHAVVRGRHQLAFFVRETVGEDKALQRNDLLLHTGAPRNPAPQAFAKRQKRG